MSDVSRRMENAAFGHAWKGFTEAELQAADDFGLAVAFLPPNPEESFEDDEQTMTVDGMHVSRTEMETVYQMVDVSNVLESGQRYGVVLGQIATISVMTPEDKEEKRTGEVVIESSAMVFDTSVEPPIPTGEEYHRPAITVELADDGATITDRHFTSPELPVSLDVLLELREDQKRYADLLGLVTRARVLRGEITEEE